MEAAEVVHRAQVLLPLLPLPPLPLPPWPFRSSVGGQVAVPDGGRRTVDGGRRTGNGNGTADGSRVVRCVVVWYDYPSHFTVTHHGGTKRAISRRYLGPTAHYYGSPHGFTALRGNLTTPRRRKDLAAWPVRCRLARQSYSNSASAALMRAVVCVVVYYNMLRVIDLCLRFILSIVHHEYMSHKTIMPQPSRIYF